MNDGSPPPDRNSPLRRPLSRYACAAHQHSVRDGAAPATATRQRRRRGLPPCALAPSRAPGRNWGTFARACWVWSGAQAMSVGGAHGRWRDTRPRHISSPDRSQQWQPRLSPISHQIHPRSPLGVSNNAIASLSLPRSYSATAGHTTSPSSTDAQAAEQMAMYAGPLRCPDILAKSAEYYTAVSALGSRSRRTRHVKPRRLILTVRHNTDRVIHANNAQKSLTKNPFLCENKLQEICHPVQGSEPWYSERYSVGGAYLTSTHATSIVLVRHVRLRAQP